MQHNIIRSASSAQPAASRMRRTAVRSAVAIGITAAISTAFPKPVCAAQSESAPQTARELAKAFRETDVQRWEEIEKEVNTAELEVSQKKLREVLPYSDVDEATNEPLVSTLYYLLASRAFKLRCNDRATKLEVRNRLIQILDLPKYYGLDDQRNMRLIELVMRHWDVTPNAPSEETKAAAPKKPA